MRKIFGTAVIALGSMALAQPATASVTFDGVSGYSYEYAYTYQGGTINQQYNYPSGSSSDPTNPFVVSGSVNSSSGVTKSTPVPNRPPFTIANPRGGFTFKTTTTPTAAASAVGGVYAVLNDATSGTLGLSSTTSASTTAAADGTTYAEAYTQQYIDYNFTTTSAATVTVDYSIGDSNSNSYNYDNYICVSSVTCQYFSPNSTGQFTFNAPSGNISISASDYYNDQISTSGPGVTSVSGARNNVFAFSIGAVPEPTTWAMMVLGFGLIGFGLRRRQQPVATVTFAA